MAPVTVCIAARSTGGMIFRASDRMLTSGDIQFEPPSQKVLYLTSAIMAMTSGDAAFQSEILQGVRTDMAELLKGATEWIKVGVVADLT